MLAVCVSNCPTFTSSQHLSINTCAIWTSVLIPSSFYSVFFLKLNGEISLFSAGNDAFGQAFQVVKSFEHVSQDIKSEIDSERFDWILPRLLNTRLQPVSRWPLFVFILSAMICLSMSTVYHLFSAHSRRIYALTSRLDYAGISILIAGSFFPPIYYIYFCREGIF